ncbi:SWI/SNF-related matrix-associated actin-dependent regulator of chromatin subfamily A-like protein 1 isoform X1 [Acropora muricata]|uniref:SWI/SNF-related matrix-associated actin-dependent regulator of chromatin subfamily A-like protein 1 isoform X1 n=1 Tax=Acropora muricata TaxID=159855 RepID=UPI0034E5E860
MSSSSLSEEQRKRIAENRRKALEKRAAILTQRQQLTSSVTSRQSATGKFINAAPQHKHYARNASMPQTQLSLHSTECNATSRSDVGQAKSNADIFTEVNGQANSSRIDSGTKILGSSGAGTSANKTLSDSSSINSFQSSLLKFCRPQNNPSSSTKNSEISKAVSNTADITNKGKEPSKIGGTSSLDSRKAAKEVKGYCVLISRDRFAVVVPYEPQLIGIFKTMPSRKYDAKAMQWDFSLHDYAKLIQAVKTLSTHVTVEGLPKAVISTFLKASPGILKELSTSEINLNSVDFKLVEALMPFQRQGVSFSIRHDGRVLIADDMGLGKTIQAICVACYYRPEWPLLVVTPSSLRITWQQAFIRWLPSVDPEYINVILTGKDSPTAGLINIISYDLLSKCIDVVKKKQFGVVIADESHFIKNYKASRTQAMLPLLKAATRVILLSGTPALSRPLELYTQICAIEPGLFPTFHQFGIRYCAGQQNRFGWDFSGASNMQELQLLLEEKVMIRRLKKDVLSQLPSKQRQMVLLDPSLVKTKILEKAAKEVSKAKQKEQHGALLHYFFETCASKIPAVRDYILDLLEGGRKFLVFAHHKDMLDAICSCLTQKKYKFIRIDGSTAAGVRQGLCDHFQQDKDCLVAVLSITAANTGLTLTEANAVVFAELFWNPGALVQAEDRVYRIGQKNSVNIHYLVAKKTADDYLWPLIQNKLEVLGKAGLSEEELDADCTFFKDPKQQTLFSCVESFVEDYSIDNSKDLFGDPSSSSNTDSNSIYKYEAKYSDPAKKVEGEKSSGGSEARKRKPQFDAAETGSDVVSESTDNFDWLEDLGNDDFIPDDFLETDFKDLRPSAKRYRL